MPRHDHIDDAAIEAFFTGNGAGEELAPLAAFAEELRALASGPAPAPSVQLAAMLSEGFSTEQGDLSATAASNVPGPAPQAAGLPEWRKKKMIEFLAGLSVAAKAAFGVSMAAASIGGAAAAGVPIAQAAVEAVSPVEFHDNANDKAGLGGGVSDDPRDGAVDGKTVAEEAKDNGDGAGQEKRPAEPGQNGLDQANTTPAAGHVPTSLPSGRPATATKPATAGSQSSTGMDAANATPAADYLPEAVPAGPATADQYRPGDTDSDSSTGTDTADGTPAASYLPGSVPPAPPAGRP